MGLEAITAGHLEVDLFLEQHRFLAQQLGDGGFEHLVQLLETVVEGRDVFDTADQVLAVPLQAFFVIDPMAAGDFGHIGQFPGPLADSFHFAGIEGATQYDKTVVPEFFDLPIIQLGGPQGEHYSCPYGGCGGGILLPAQGVSTASINTEER